MIRFSSHAQQVAALGTAAAIDPIRFPRRYDQQQARERFNRGMTGVARDDAFLRRKSLAERAVLYTDMTVTDAARAMGCSVDTLKTVAEEFSLTFRNRYQQYEGEPFSFDFSSLNQYERKAAEGKIRRAKLAEQAKQLAHLTMREASEKLGVSYDVIRKLATEFSLDFKPGFIGRPRQKGACECNG